MNDLLYAWQKHSIFIDDPKRLGRPEGFTLNVREVILLPVQNLQLLYR